MYDPAITAAAIEASNAQIADACRQAGQDPWTLVEHTPAQIDHAIRHLDALYDPEARALVRDLRPDEQQFIRNERRLCALDFRGYWLTRYARIINWERQPAPFVPNVAQHIVLDLWAESERNGEAIWMQQLKARRLGVSTISELNVCHRFQFQPHANCVVASADPTKTLEMAGMVKYCLDEQPWWLLPQAAPRIRQGIPIEFADLGSRLTFQAGNQFTGVAQGSTPSVIHLSELCLWRDAHDLIDLGLLPAVLDTPDVFGILESTAQGPGWWKTRWEQTKRDWARGTSRMRPVFLPWFVGTDIYPTPADLRKRPIPADWTPADRTVKHAERARAYVRQDPLLFQHLAKGDPDWTLPRPQLWWYEIGYETAREEKTLNSFLASYCGDDFEAFQSSNIPVIDTEILLGYQERTRHPQAVYTVIGPDIPQHLVVPARHWDTSQPTITIRTRPLMPMFDAKYQLVPLQFSGYPTFDEGLKLLVWEPPTEGFLYGLGVDAAEGLGQDNTVIEVLREATPLVAPGQVAEWASNQVTAFQLWPIVCAVATWYSTVHPVAGERRQARVAIETWSNGSAAQEELRKRGWSNFHPWVYNDSKRRKGPGDATRIGVMTNQWFRSVMQDMLLTCLSEEAIDLPSPYLVQELVTLERAPGQRKVQAEYGAHDDRFMGIGFPLFSLHQHKPPRAQHARRRVAYAPGVESEPTVAYPIWRPPDQAGSGHWTGRPVQALTDRFSTARLGTVVVPTSRRG